VCRFLPRLQPRAGGGARRWHERLCAVDDSTPRDRLVGACAQADRAAAERLLAGYPDLASRLDARDQAMLVDAAEYGGAAQVTLMAPSDEVAAVLAGYGIGEPGEEPPPRPSPAPATPATRRVAEALHAAFDTADEQALAALLHPDVRWGGGPAGCHSRAQVLEWYQGLRARGVHATVRETTIAGDTVILGLAVGLSGRAPAKGADLFYQAFTVDDDGSVVEIRGANRPETD
jgi:hypothetical protein